MIPTGDRWTATGKRKSAIARVILTQGTGKVNIRKWRKLPTDTQGNIAYFDKKAGEVTEEPMVFPEKVEGNQWVVPRTARAGKTPFRYTPSEEYFGRETLRMIIQQPFSVTNTSEQFDVWVNVTGGGLSGQAGAIRHGIAKALVAYEIANSTDAPASDEEEEGFVVQKPIRQNLKRAGLLTRDARVKERKKYGQPGARKKFQFSKR